MKIHSKFQDYYDSALGSFTESEVSVIRKKSEVEIPYNDIPDLDEFDGRWNTVCKGRCGDIYGHKPISLVGFCGTWYYFVSDCWPNGTASLYNIEYKTINEIIENNKIQSLFKWKQSSTFKDPNNEPYFKELFEKYGPVLFIENFNPMLKKFASFNRNKNVHIEIWPELKAIKFQTVKDPYTALWELEHWYDTHARPDDAVVPVGDDLTRIKAAGFDTKTSFRKMKRD